MDQVVSVDADDADVVCCDDDSLDTFTATPSDTASVPASTCDCPDDDVLICDMPARNESEAFSACTGQHLDHVDLVPDSAFGHHSAATRGLEKPTASAVGNVVVAAATRPRQGISADDDVVLMDESHPSPSETVTAQGDVIQCGDSSVIVLD